MVEIMKQKISKDTITFVEKEDSELYSIKINKGRFKGVIFTYGKVNLNEDKEKDQLGVNFKFIVNKGNTRYSMEELNENIKFKKFLADLLKYLLEEEFAYNDKHTTTDIKEDM